MVITKISYRFSKCKNMSDKNSATAYLYDLNDKKTVSLTPTFTRLKCVIACIRKTSYVDFTFN